MLFNSHTALQHSIAVSHVAVSPQAFQQKPVSDGTTIWMGMSAIALPISFWLAIAFVKNYRQTQYQKRIAKLEHLFSLDHNYQD